MYDGAAQDGLPMEVRCLFHTTIHYTVREMVQGRVRYRAQIACWVGFLLLGVYPQLWYSWFGMGCNGLYVFLLFSFDFHFLSLV